jgi:hypothetical protein
MFHLSIRLCCRLFDNRRSVECDMGDAITMAARKARWLTGLAALCALAACAGTQQIVNHSFMFEMARDGQDAVVLDYLYGDPAQPSARNPERLAHEGKSLQGTDVSGPLLRGDSLYVKWRVKTTGRIYEDTVDLRQRLPADIGGKILYFMIKGPQLYVYVISQEPRPANSPPIGPRVFSYLKTTKIYPDEVKP